jgi:hypothetical protein
MEVRMSDRESTEQGASGRRGAQASQTEGEGRQPRQGSNRVEQPRGEEEPKHHFEGGRAPSEQGERDHRSPEVIAREQQGLAGRGGASGSHGARNDQSEELSARGEPQEDHTRHGRQETPGDRQTD